MMDPLEKCLPQSDEDVGEVSVFFEAQTAKDGKTPGSQNKPMESVTDMLSHCDGERKMTIDMDRAESSEEENDQQVNDNEKNSYSPSSVTDQARTERSYELHSSQTEPTHDVSTDATLNKEISYHYSMKVDENRRTGPVKAKFKLDECDRHFHSETDLDSHVQRTCMNKYSVLKEFNYGQFLENEVFLSNKSRFGQKHQCQECVDLQTQVSCTTTAAAFKCDVCWAVFECQVQLKQHKQYSLCCRNIQSGKTAVVCDLCQTTFFSPENLMHHIRLVHARRMSGFCKVCRKTYRDVHLCREHMRSVHKVRDISTIRREMLQCIFCPLKFYSHCSQEIYNHLQKHHTIETAPTMDCDICGVEFQQKLAFHYHMKNVHSVRVKDNAVGVNVLEEEMNPSYKCGEIVSQNSLDRHIKEFHTEHAPVNCKVCDKKLQSEIHLECHMQRHGTHPPRVCHICGAKLKTDQGLKLHLANHTGVKSHMCHICGVSFVKKTSWQRHIGQHAETTFQCDVCAETFTTYSSLHYHLLLKHQRGAYFNNRLRTLEEQGHPVDAVAVSRHLDHACVICGDKLINGKCVSHPTDYMLTFQCNECEMTEERIVLFCHHLKIHENAASSGSSSSSSSARSSSLSRDISDRGEAPVTCTCKVCSRSVPDGEYVRRRMKQHREKDFLCPGRRRKRFTCNCHLKNYLMTSLEDKHFKCHLCGKRLACKQHLLSHYRLVHSKRHTDPAMDTSSDRHGEVFSRIYDSLEGNEL